MLFDDYMHDLRYCVYIGNVIVTIFIVLLEIENLHSQTKLILE